MTKENPGLQTWQIWQVARKYLGVKTLCRLYGVKARTIYDYAQNPSSTEQRTQKDPLQRLHYLLTQLDDLGFGQYARAAIVYLQTALEDGGHHGPVIEPMDSINEEILLDYKLVAKLQEAIDNGEPVEYVARLKQEVVEEVERTYLRYLKDNEVTA